MEFDRVHGRDKKTGTRPVKLYGARKRFTSRFRGELWNGLKSLFLIQLFKTYILRVLIKFDW